MDGKVGAFFEELRGKRVWFVGIGVSHRQTIELFARRGVLVTACDKRERSALGHELCAHLESLGVRLLLGQDYPADFAPAQVLFRTPGMYYNQPALQHYRTHGGVLTSEMEVFCGLCPCPLTAVTGSDGKTTTTALIAEMLAAQGFRTHLGGNIGKALLPALPELQPADRAVVELSSFQLISMRCAPKVAVVTNVTPNHLDVHGGMEEYTETKRNLLAHQDAFSATVLNADNPATASFAPQVRGQCLLFSMEGPVENGAFYSARDSGVYTAAHGQKPKKLMDAADIRIPGLHNVANYLAAICAVRGAVDDDVIRGAAASFSGVEHRIELVRELDGVCWYNDSIATSPTRAIAGLNAFDRRIIMLAGGYDKKIPFEPLAPVVSERVKVLILCGATAGKIQAVVQADPAFDHKKTEIIQVEDLPEAVRTARGLSRPGDIISLSPACASFDKYPNFEARGRHFKELVNAL